MSVNGANWAETIDHICDHKDENEQACTVGSTYSGEQMSIKSLEYYEQIAIADQFQAFIPNYNTATE